MSKIFEVKVKDFAPQQHAVQTMNARDLRFASILYVFFFK